MYLLSQLFWDHSNGTFFIQPVSTKRLTVPPFVVNALLSYSHYQEEQTGILLSALPFSAFLVILVASVLYRKNIVGDPKG